MRPIFSPEGQAALARVMAQRPLLAFDFDGTLAAIVPRPQDARPTRAVSARLAALAARLPVAVVSGRRLDDLRTRLGFEPTYLVGNHGAEGSPPWPVSDAAGAALAPLRARIAAAGASLAEAGVTVEDKGASLALHYRLARDRTLARARVAELLGPADPELHVFGGKAVVNVVPHGAPDKADAVLALARHCGAAAAVVLGDDLNDEPVFAAAPPHWLTVRVGRGDGGSCARWFIDSPAQTALLLDRMLALPGGRLTSG